MSEEIRQGEFRFPATASVAYGPGALERLPAFVDGHGARRVLAIVSSSVDGIDERLRQLLGRRFAGSFRGARMHVPRESVLEAARAAREARADLLVSVGGGTPIDCASAACLCLAYDVAEPAQLDEFRVRFTYPDTLEVPAIERALVPHVAVPTTLSGAESTSLFGVTDPERGVKHLYSSPRFAASEIVFDPLLAAQTPAWLWASSGMRAVDHAVEGVLSSRHMAMGDALALEGLRILAGRLVQSARDPHDVQARLDCQMGAWLAVYALTNVGVGLSHGIGHQLAGAFPHIPHGVTSACMLPHVMAFNAEHTAPRLRRVAQAMGVDVRAMDDAQAAVAAVAAVRAFVRSLEPLGVPHSIEAAGGTRSALAHVAERTLEDASVAANPRAVSRTDLLALLDAAWKG